MRWLLRFFAHDAATAESAPHLTEALDQAWRREALRNARLVNYGRALVATLFFALHVVLGAVLHDEAWRGSLRDAALYWIAALLLLGAYRRRESLGRVGGWIVAVLDVPMVFLIQSGSLATSTSERAVSRSICASSEAESKPSERSVEPLTVAAVASSSSSVETASSCAGAQPDTSRAAELQASAT